MVMGLAGVSETVTVTAEAPAATATPRTTHTFTKAEIDALPVGRRPTDIAELSPGLTPSVFNASGAQLSLGGAFGYDNVFMVNGVDVNDNISGISNNLFIEDAVQETTVLTHGVSAEWGRFSGGVISVVTKSGGNSFSGSFREGLSNPKWIGRTPLERAANVVRADVLGKTHEGTFGGPISRDRLWFFTAGRYEHVDLPNTLAMAGPAYTRVDTNRRGELKVTGTLMPGHTAQASVIDNFSRQERASGVGAAALLDPDVLVDRELPNRLFVTSYNGAVSPTLLASVQYSQKTQSFRNNGGSSLDMVHSPFRTRGATAGVPANLFYNAPYFDATDPEQRDNRQVTGSVSYLMASPRFGSHDFKAGGEYFRSIGVGGNSQSSTSYVFITDYLVENGRVARDAAGSPIPVFTPGVSQVWNFIANRGSQLNIDTTSLFVQDRWIATPRLTLDLGARFESVSAVSTGDVESVDTASIAPRVAASYDLQGNGRTVLYATYGHYAGRYGLVQFGVNSNVARPSEVDYVYSGPAGQGDSFAPGFDLANYTQVVNASFPTANVRMADDLRSPVTREFTAAIGRELGDRGYAKVTYARRHATDIVEDFVSLANGTVSVPNVGTLTNRVYGNTDELFRDYQALMVQSSYRPRANMSVGGHYTVQIRNHGNTAGEAANQPGIPSIFGNFVEVFEPAYERLIPEGRLDNFQRHKLRIYGTYSQSFGRFGTLDLTPLWRVNSGGVYSLTASVPVTAQMLARNPGYPTTDLSASTRPTIFFGDRGAHDFAGYSVVDLAASYNVRAWESVQPWFKIELYNVLNNQKVIAWDRTVTVDPNSPLDANGFRTGYVQGPRFGQPTSGAHFPQPYLGQNGSRTMRLAFGVRF
jgi:outer membrane receptor protein involved in Fe transport